jgi:hypothetical protein
MEQACIAKLRPAKHFLLPQTVDVDFGHNFVGKQLNLACFGLKIRKNILEIFLRPEVFFIV